MFARLSTIAYFSLLWVACSARSTGAAAARDTTQVSGRIQMRYTDNRTLGYMNNWNFTPNYINGSYELRVTLTGSDPYYNLLSTNPADSLFVGSSGVGPLEIGSSNTAGFGLVTPQSEPGTSAVNQTAIWGYDSTTRRLTPTFINPNGAKAPTHLAYDPYYAFDFFTGDLDAYKQVFTDSTAGEIYLYLEDLA